MPAALTQEGPPHSLEDSPILGFRRAFSCKWPWLSGTHMTPLMAQEAGLQGSYQQHRLFPFLESISHS